MEVRHLVHIHEFIACELAAERNEQGEWVVKKQRDGNPLFTLLCKVKRKQRFGLKEIEVEETEKLNSTIEVKPGSKNLTFECEQYVIAANNGGRPNLYYRAVKLIEAMK